MPRCTTSTSSPSRPIRRYLPARRTDATRLASSLVLNSGPLLCRRMDRFPFTSTVLMRRPTTSLSRSRRMVSTSGSSGTASYPPIGDGHDGRAALVECSPRDARRGLLGIFLGTSLAHAALGPGHQDPGPVAAGVVGPGAL